MNGFHRTLDGGTHAQQSAHDLVAVACEENFEPPYLMNLWWFREGEGTIGLLSLRLSHWLLGSVWSVAVQVVP